DGSGERPKRKHDCYLCGGPHWTRECPRRDALSAIARAGEESSHTGEVSHMEKSEPGEAEDVALISPNLRQRPGGNVAKPEESSHKGEPKPEEARDVAQDAGEPRQQQDVDAAETCGNLREGSRHSTLGALTRASRALVGESVTAREFGGRSRGHRGTELQPWAHRGCVQRPRDMPSGVAECEREDRREHEHGRQQKRSRKRGRGHAGRGCRCRDTGLRLRHIRIRGRSGPCQRRRRYQGRGVKLRTGRVGACVSSRGRHAWASESVLGLDTGARTGKLGRDAGSHGCEMARGAGARERRHGRKHNMGRSGGKPCIRWPCQCHGRGMGSRSRHAGACRSGRERPQNRSCARSRHGRASTGVSGPECPRSCWSAQEWPRSLWKLQDARRNSTRAGTVPDKGSGMGLMGQAQPGVSPGPCR
ncbi:hypothetical protein SLEP1_g60474, partial [Rubroshorea leprosula]